MRDVTIAALRDVDRDREVSIAGRVTHVDPMADRAPRGELTDASGVIGFIGRGDARVGDLRVGDIVSLQGRLVGATFEVARASVLVGPVDGPGGEERRLGDPAMRARVAARSSLLRAIRGYFNARGFLEVETGAMVDEPGQEPTLDLFAPEPGRYLATSPELRMKRLLAAGYERIFELSRSFRGGAGERSAMHHPEFTLLEWYRAFEDETALIDDLERLLPSCAAALSSGLASRLTAPFERLTVTEAFASHADVDLEPFLDGDARAFRAAARRAGVRAVGDDEDPTALYFRVFLDRVEPKLGRDRPTLLTRFPSSMAALARVDDDDPRCARRFECFVDGVELANAFFELTDPDEQRRRFELEREEKRSSGRDPGPMPERFLRALRAGMPPSAGIALGVDRLLMLLIGAQSIDDVLLFPDPPASFE